MIETSERVRQTSKYIAAGIREVVQEDFRQPIEKAVEGPIRSNRGGGLPCAGGGRAPQGGGPLPDLDRVRPHPGPGLCSGSLRDVLLLHPASVGDEQPFRPLGADAGRASTCCSGNPCSAAAEREKAWSALKAGYGFHAQALGTRI